MIHIFTISNLSLLKSMFVFKYVISNQYQHTFHPDFFNSARVKVFMISLKTKILNVHLISLNVYLISDIHFTHGEYVENAKIRTY